MPIVQELKESEESVRLSVRIENFEYTVRSYTGNLEKVREEKEGLLPSDLIPFVRE